MEKLKKLKIISSFFIFLIVIGISNLNFALTNSGSINADSIHAVIPAEYDLATGQTILSIQWNFTDWTFSNIGSDALHLTVVNQTAGIGGVHDYFQVYIFNYTEDYGFYGFNFRIITTSSTAFNDSSLLTQISKPTTVNMTIINNRCLDYIDNILVWNCSIPEYWDNSFLSHFTDLWVYDDNANGTGTFHYTISDLASEPTPTPTVTPTNSPIPTPTPSHINNEFNVSFWFIFIIFIIISIFFLLYKNRTLESITINGIIMFAGLYCGFIILLPVDVILTILYSFIIIGCFIGNVLMTETK